MSIVPRLQLAPFIKQVFFSFHFSFFILVDDVMKIRKYFVIVCLFSIIFHFRLARLAMQTENIVQKITQKKGMETFRGQ